MMEQNETSVTQPLVNISRRRFLKVLGAASAGAAAGCATDQTQKILPYVKGEVEQIPGKAVWYSSTCTECSAGCGIRVRTREGRAVKIEGNELSPVNKGSLCGLGQAALQNLYDPDRIREPLMLEAITPEGPKFKAVSWDEALAAVVKALATGGKRYFISGELPTAHSEIVATAAKKWDFEQIVWDSSSQVALAQSSERVFGVYGIPEYSIDKADVLLNFGADFLETWVSPCEFARQWSDGRRRDTPLRFVHVEPRLSLTGANADTWLRAKPGTEVHLAWAILGLLLARGMGGSIRSELRSSLVQRSAKYSAESASAVTGVPREKILLVADYLASAGSSLVLAGGTSVSTEEQLPLLVVTQLLNLVLGNVGKTIKPSSVNQPKSSLKRVVSAIEEMKATNGKVDLVFVHGTNPAYSLPGGIGLQYALKSVSSGNGKDRKPGKVVAFASHMDETAALADIILPVHTALEDWGYVDLGHGRISLMQPAMGKIFDTKGLGDLLIEIGKGVQKPLSESDDFFGFVKAGFLKQVAGKSTGDSDKIWFEALERGGWFSASDSEISYRVALDSASVIEPGESHGSHGEKLLLYPFPSVKSFDGRAANRPWLQELPDPITQLVWDTWAELHPETAVKLGVERASLITLRTEFGEVTAPVYITEWVDKGIVAVPLGQGHSQMGRFAKTVGDGNLFSLFSAKQAKDVDGLAIMSLHIEPIKARGAHELVTVQGKDSQMGRELARTSLIGAAASHVANAHGEHAEHSNHAEHHEPKQMYTQREHPLYQWGMAIDLAACTGCSACVVACYAENNIAVVGKKVVGQGREMSWLRIERYYDELPSHDGAMELKVSFMPMMCQHCQNAPCEPVCPVYATYHNEEGVNAMVYNRCVGTRYCANNCSYKVRRFNFFDYEWPELLDWQLNPDVTKRGVGVMEKCSFCVQRVQEAKDNAKDLGRAIEDGEVKPACVQGCPTRALTFGNLKDPNSAVSKLAKSGRAYKVLDHHINTQPSVSYLEDIRYKA